MSGSVATMRWRLAQAAALAVLAWAWACASGCDSGKPRARSVNVPGGTSDSKPASDASAANLSNSRSFGREAHVIVPVEGSPAALTWERAARIEASAARSLLVVHKIKKPEDQAAEIGKAVRDGASFIILAPEPTATDLPAAIAAAAAQKVPVVVVNQKLEGLKEGVPVVLPEAYEGPANAMVRKVREDMQFHGLTLGSLFIAVDRAADPQTADRTNAIETAAKAAGFTTIQRVEFEGGSDGALTALRKAFTDNPKFGAVIAENASGFDGATRLRLEYKNEPKREIVIAGFCSYHDGLPVAEGHNCAIVYQLNSRGIMQRAFQNAAKLIASQKAPELTRVPFMVGVGDPKVELQFRDMNKSMGKKKMPME